ncbi:hypothetical protein L1887_62538 [Cichorium endivia]|nr:hypothetical protein L1887_62538 [Cichorium endivia]
MVGDIPQREHEGSAETGGDARCGCARPDVAGIGDVVTGAKLCPGRQGIVNGGGRLHGGRVAAEVLPSSEPSTLCGLLRVHGVVDACCDVDGLRDGVGAIGWSGWS